MERNGGLRLRFDMGGLRQGGLRVTRQGGLRQGQSEKDCERLDLAARPPCVRKVDASLPKAPMPDAVSAAISFRSPLRQRRHQRTACCCRERIFRESHVADFEGQRAFAQRLLEAIAEARGHCGSAREHDRQRLVGAR